MKLIPLDGYFTPLEKGKINTRAKLIAILSGGPIVSLILVIGLGFLNFGGISFNLEVITPEAIEFFINAAFFINLFILIMSLIPAHYFLGEIKGLETDGLQIINAFKNK